MKVKWNKRRWNQLAEKWEAQMNHSASMTVGGKSFSFQPMRLGILLLAGLLALVILVNLLQIPMHRPKTVDMDFETGGDYTMIPYAGDILMYNNQQIRRMNTRGKTVWSADVFMSHPMVETAGDYLLLADMGGNNRTVLYKNEKLCREYTIGNDIISAKVNKKGWVAFATATVGYKGKVTVFDKKGKERFQWNSGDGYILDIALSDDGHWLAVAQLSSEGSRSDSRIQFIDLRRKKVTATAEKNGALFADLRFSENRLLAVSDTELCGFKTSGKEVFSVSFAGKNPGRYDISSDEVLAFVATDNLGNAVVELYDTGGKLKGRYQADSNVHNLSVFEDMVVITRNRDVLYMNTRGRLKKTATARHDIKGLGVFGDGHTALAAGNTEAYIVRMR